MGKSTKLLTDIHSELFEELYWSDVRGIFDDEDSDLERPYDEAEFPDKEHPLKPTSVFRKDADRGETEIVALLPDGSITKRPFDYKKIADEDEVFLKTQVRHSVIEALIHAGCVTSYDAVTFLQGMPDGRSGTGKGISRQAASTYFRNPCGMTRAQVEWLSNATGYTLEELRAAFWENDDHSDAIADAKEAAAIVSSLRKGTRQLAMAILRGYETMQAQGAEIEFVDSGTGTFAEIFGQTTGEFERTDSPNL